jgi:negative regulator of replication initiation
MVKTIQVSDEFHSYLASHGNFGDRMEDILIRLLGDKFKIPSGDRATKIYSSKNGGKK